MHYYRKWQNNAKKLLTNICSIYNKYFLEKVYKKF